jgi:hypothetical protein
VVCASVSSTTLSSGACAARYSRIELGVMATLPLPYLNPLPCDRIADTADTLDLDFESCRRELPPASCPVYQ